MEFKTLEFEIKAVDDKGKFTGIASPYNTVDYGNDRVLPSIAARNNNKSVPMLWQHDQHEPIGSMVLKSTPTGMEVSGQFVLDTTENGTPAVPNAVKAYALSKKGLLKLSIGYNTIKCSYDKDGVRNLEDIDIGEVSGVTFPMNDGAGFTSVKANENKGGKDVKEKKDVKATTTKALSFQDLLKVQQAQEMQWNLTDALRSSTNMLMNDIETALPDKIKQLSDNVDAFGQAYKDCIGTILNAKASGSKEIDKILEIKEAARKLETKAGKTLNKQNTDTLQAVLQQLQSMLDDATPPPDDSDDPIEDPDDDPVDPDDEDKSKKEKAKKDEEKQIKELFDSLKNINQNFKNTK